MISFLVPTYNAEETLSPCLDSIMVQRGPKEILIIDDGSTDGSADVASSYASRCPEVRLLRKIHGGEASALNFGIGEARGDLIAFVEADVELSPDWLEKLLPEFRDARVAGAGGRILPCPDDPWAARIAGYEVMEKMGDRRRSAMHISSANAIYRREILDLWGPFEEELYNSCFDANFNLRVVSSGRTLIYNPCAEVRHHYRPGVLGYLARQFQYARYRPYLKRLKLYRGDRDLILLTALGGGVLLSIPLGLLWPPLPLLAGIALLCSRIPMAVRFYMRYRDRAAFLYPVMGAGRGIIGAIGCLVGLLEKSLGREILPR